MNQSTKTLVQKGEGCQKTGKIDNIPGMNPVKLDFIIDAAIVEWVEAHPEMINKYSDIDFIQAIIRKSKVIYL